MTLEEEAEPHIGEEIGQVLVSHEPFAISGESAYLTEWKWRDVHWLTVNTRYQGYFYIFHWRSESYEKVVTLFDLMLPHIRFVSAPAPLPTPIAATPTPGVDQLRAIVAEASILDIRKFQAFDPGTDLLQVNIDLDLGFTLTATGLMEAQIATYDIMKAIYQGGLPVGEVNLWFWAEFQDAYGNVRDDVAHKAMLTKLTADRINWGNPDFFYEQLWNVLDYKWSWK